MTKYITIAILFIAFTSCTKPIVNGVKGEWELIEIDDPNDDFDSFQTIESDKRLTFHEDGNVEVLNGSFCDLDAETGESITEYNIEANSLSSSTCDVICHLFHRYEIDSNDNLLLYYPCSSGFTEKYVKK